MGKKILKFVIIFICAYSLIFTFALYRSNPEDLELDYPDIVRIEIEEDSFV